MDKPKLTPATNFHIQSLEAARFMDSQLAKYEEIVKQGKGKRLVGSEGNLYGYEFKMENGATMTVEF